MSRREALRAVRDGYLAHYDDVAAGDADLALLDGDRLYALGLERLVQDGDVEGVAALADLISACAAARAAGDQARAEGAWKAIGATWGTPLRDG